MIPDKHLESLAPCLVGRDGKPLVRTGVTDSQALGSQLSEEEMLEEEDEADMSMLSQNVQLLPLTIFSISLSNPESAACILFCQKKLNPVFLALWSKGRQDQRGSLSY